MRKREQIGVAKPVENRRLAWPDGPGRPSSTGIEACARCTNHNDAAVARDAANLRHDIVRPFELLEAVPDEDAVE